MECDWHAIKTPTTGVFDFPSLILGGKGKYVDKTDLLYRLCNDADQQLFISRPRRFGKSLMLSTLIISSAMPIPISSNILLISAMDFACLLIISFAISALSVVSETCISIN